MATRRWNSAVRNHPHRGGWTLIELVTVLAINGVILLVSVGLLATLLRAKAATETGRRAELEWSRLAAQFRADVEAASDVETIGDGQDTAFRLVREDGGAVDYAFDPQAAAMTRHVSRPSEAKPVARDVYTFAKGTRFALTRDLGNGSVVSLLHRREDGLPAGHRFTTARLGWDRRFADRSAGKSSRAEGRATDDSPSTEVEE